MLIILSWFREDISAGILTITDYRLYDTHAVTAILYVITIYIYQYRDLCVELYQYDVVFEMIQPWTIELFHKRL